MSVAQDQREILGRKISMDVQRSERLIADVISVEEVGDKKTFRITFRDGTRACAREALHCYCSARRLTHAAARRR